MVILSALHEAKKKVAILSPVTTIGSTTLKLQEELMKTIRIISVRMVYGTHIEQVACQERQGEQSCKKR
jgi:hypothetical protein